MGDPISKVSSRLLIPLLSVRTEQEVEKVAGHKDAEVLERSGNDISIQALVFLHLWFGAASVTVVPADGPYQCLQEVKVIKEHSYVCFARRAVLHLFLKCSALLGAEESHSIVVRWLL